MDFRQHDDTIIELRLTDRRGRPVRASVCDRLLIRVWTQDPQRFLSFFPRDIREKDGKDFIVIPDYEMAALAPGVVVYRYSFREPVYGHHDDRHDGPHGFDHGGDYERSETVVTNVRWHGLHSLYPERVPANPVNAYTLEHLKQTIEDIHRELSRKIRDIRLYVTEEYSNGLKEETDRAERAEKALLDALTDAQTKISEEIRRSTEVDIKFLDHVNKLYDLIEGLKKDLGELEQSGADAVENLGKTLNESLDSLRDMFENSVRDLESRISERIDADEKKVHKAIDKVNERISDALEKKAVLDTEQSLAISGEITRAKGEETRIETKVDELKDMATRKVKSLGEDIDNLGTKISKNSTAISDNADEIAAAKRSLETLRSELDTERSRAESSEAILSGRIDEAKRLSLEESERAKLVEKDITESLQRLKQAVADGQSATTADLSSLKAELLARIDYRISEVVGEAPEAFDTLEEIAAKLKEDDDIFKAIREILVLKANASDVYTTGAVDALLLDISNSIKAEAQRAALAEQRNAEAIGVLNGDADTIGSVEHAKADANHYTDDAIKQHRREVVGILDTLKKDLEESIDAKQDRGDYVSYTQGEGRKHVILPNNCNIVGTTQDGTDGRNLIMLSKWNVVDIGSANNPVNLNGLNERPTYNDGKELALLEDVKAAEIEGIDPATIKGWFRKR